MKVLAGTLNKEKALVGAFSSQFETSERFIDSSNLFPCSVCPALGDRHGVLRGGGAAGHDAAAGQPHVRLPLQADPGHAARGLPPPQRGAVRGGHVPRALGLHTHAQHRGGGGRHGAHTRGGVGGGEKVY